ncbi:hypothetical protein B0H19DRAFT_1146015 [Mycena capillaripes]|nr:hypothetical protein B0H19DRAFT_1146015 [Mycena capillaripes]
MADSRARLAASSHIHARCFRGFLRSRPRIRGTQRVFGAQHHCRLEDAGAHRLHEEGLARQGGGHRCRHV